MKRIGKRIAAGLLDGIGVNLVKANISGDTNQPGKIDWWRMVTAIITILLLVGVLAGKITIDDVTKILNGF